MNNSNTQLSCYARINSLVNLTPIDTAITPTTANPVIPPRSFNKTKSPHTPHHLPGNHTYQHPQHQYYNHFGQHSSYNPIPPVRQPQQQLPHQLPPTITSPNTTINSHLTPSSLSPHISRYPHLFHQKSGSAHNLHIISSTNSPNLAPTAHQVSTQLDQQQYPSSDSPQPYEKDGVSSMGANNTSIVNTEGSIKVHHAYSATNALTPAGEPQITAYHLNDDSSCSISAAQPRTAVDHSAMGLSFTSPTSTKPCIASVTLGNPALSNDPPVSLQHSHHQLPPVKSMINIHPFISRVVLMPTGPATSFTSLPASVTVGVISSAQSKLVSPSHIPTPSTRPQLPGSAVLPINPCQSHLIPSRAPSVNTPAHLPHLDPRHPSSASLSTGQRFSVGTSTHSVYSSFGSMTPLPFTPLTTIHQVPQQAPSDGYASSCVASIDTPHRRHSRQLSSPPPISPNLVNVNSMPTTTTTTTPASTSVASSELASRPKPKGKPGRKRRNASDSVDSSYDFVIDDHIWLYNAVMGTHITHTALYKTDRDRLAEGLTNAVNERLAKQNGGFLAKEHKVLINEPRIKRWLLHIHNKARVYLDNGRLPYSTERVPPRQSNFGNGGLVFPSNVRDSNDQEHSMNDYFIALITFRQQLQDTISPQEGIDGDSDCDNGENTPSAST